MANKTSRNRFRMISVTAAAALAALAKQANKSCAHIAPLDSARLFKVIIALACTTNNACACNKQAHMSLRVCYLCAGARVASLPTRPKYQNYVGCVRARTEIGRAFESNEHHEILCVRVCVRVYMRVIVTLAATNRARAEVEYCLITRTAASLLFLLLRLSALSQRCVREK